MGIEDIGNNVRRNMKIQGFTIAGLSSEMGIGTATLSNILNGKSVPKSTTLLKISDALKVNINDLLADPFELKTLRFRTKKLSGREKAERDQTEHDTSIWLENYKFLEDNLNNPFNYNLSSITASTPEKGAIEVRKALGLDDEEPVYNIVKLIEKAEIKLRMHPFGFQKTNGLSIGEQDGGPAIIVNSEAGIPIERQIFTIVHELGHLILHKNSYDPNLKEEKQDSEEKEADRFAGEFLVPAKGFIKEWNDSKGLNFVDSILRIKKIFNVSYQVIIHRLHQINPGYEVGELRKRFAIQYNRQYNHDLKNHYEPEAISRFDILEDRFARLVREAYDNEIISITRAGEMLNLSQQELRDRSRDWGESIELNVKLN